MGSYEMGNFRKENLSILSKPSFNTFIRKILKSKYKGLVTKKYFNEIKTSK